ncbi:MAG: DUF1320 domain-containing protein [Cyanobacteria bacterium P01_F01_bin.56]
MLFPYATRDDMVDAFTLDEMVELTNLSDPDVNTINGDTLDQALREAADEMDAYLAARHSLEQVHAIAPVPNNLVRLNCDIARYRLDNNTTRETVLQRYKDAIAFLRDVAQGKLNLNLGDSQPEPPRDRPAYQAPKPVFTRDNLSDYGSF